MSEIDKIHDKFFRKVFSYVENVRAFLQFILPKLLQEQLDFGNIEMDLTSYVSDDYKDSFSDIVAKCYTKKEKYPVDIYFLFEHKSFQDGNTPLQLLQYKLQMWKADVNEKKQPRVILPIVFYHGEKEWEIPTKFRELFQVPDEIKCYLLDFEYILFDTNEWDWQAESSQSMQENIFLISAMLLMKSAFQQNLEIIQHVFQLWQKIGFVREKELINFFMIYIVQTQDIPEEQLTEMLEESKIKGDDIMPTLAQRWEERGIEKGIEKGLLLEKQNILIMLLSTRFQLTEAEKEFVKTISDVEKLNSALKMILGVDNKKEVLDFLKL